jgi:hypothetical protein
MAIKIPIITVFDSKGLKSAQYQLNKVRGNFQALGRNAAIAGAAVAGAFTLIGKSVQNAAEAQKIMAQTEAVLKSTGTTANGTAADIAKLSEALSSQTAVDDELIQSGANLLLTFKNIQNQAGLNNDIFDQTVAATLDVARAMGTDASTEAIRLGKALNDPVKGISALTRVGIQFTAQQKDQIKALTESGDLLGAQKIILAELQSQFGGSAQAYAQTFAGQLELLAIELENLSEDIGLIVMPALKELLTAFRDIAPEAGEKLKEALGAVDWSAFAKSVADTVVFFVQNAEAILKTVTAIYALNTAYNVVKITVGLANAVIALGAIGIAGTGTAAAGATTALLLFRGALMLSGIGAVILALGFIVTGITNGGKAATDATPQLTNYGGALRKSGQDAEWAAAKYGIATTAAQNLGAAAANLPIPGRTAATSRPSRGGTRATPTVKVPDVRTQIKNTNSALDAAAKKAKAAAAKRKAAAKAAAAEEAAAAAAAAAARAERLRKEKELYKSFSDSVASTFGGIKEKILEAFSLPELGGSTNSIIRNMTKLLTKTREFSKNITQLSAMGLNPALLQQVISSGPVAGAQLAASLVAGGAAGLATINAGYAELGTLASDIGMTGTQSLFGTQAQQNIYNINVRGGLDRAPDIGKAIVEAIKAYERTSGAVWQSA